MIINIIIINSSKQVISNHFDTNHTNIFPTVVLLIFCSLPWECVSPYLSDKRLKTSPEKPIKQRLVILSLQAVLVMVSHTVTPARVNHTASCVILTWICSQLCSITG